MLEYTLRNINFLLVIELYFYFNCASDLVNISCFIEQSFLPIYSLWPTCCVS